MKDTISISDLQKTRKELIIRIEELQKDLDAMDRMMKMLGVKVNNKEEINGNKEKAVSNWNSDITPFSIPPSYQECNGWRDKTIFGLANLKEQEGFIPDIIKKLKEFDPSISSDKKGEAFKNITRWASKLKIAEQIGFTRLGVKYKYFIKKAPDM